jgi:alkanesulfonate monooxygenase SsuD/methylene tetrahydromethanopterin reductase-like flavin-dependent oxidoreductase (luciferase family)
VKLDWPPASVPPIFLGTGGPKGIALSGELADGTILTGGTTLEQVRRARALINEGRTLGDRTDPHRIVVYLFAATGPDAEARMARNLDYWKISPADDPHVTAVGDAATIAAAVERYADTGADSVILQPTADDPNPESFVTFVAEQVRPLVAR